MTVPAPDGDDWITLTLDDVKRGDPASNTRLQALLAVVANGDAAQSGRKGAERDAATRILNDIVRPVIRPSWSKLLRGLVDLEQAEAALFATLSTGAPLFAGRRQSLHQSWKPELGAFRAFASQCVFNLCREWRRHILARRANDLAEGTEELGDDEATDFWGGGVHNLAPDDLLIAEERWLAIREEVDRLPPQEREVAILRFFEELGRQEIAERLGLKPKRVSDLLSKGTAALRAALRARSLI